MVYDKKRSGDPDYDDKQPPEFHAGGLVVSAGDGVRLSQTGGPVDENGAHVNLAVDELELDTRPEPGGVAEQSSEVQQYRPEDTPTWGQEVEADSDEVEAARRGQASVRAAAEAQGSVEVTTEAAEQDKPGTTPPAKKATPAKSADASK